ncbi:MAG: hypothetical protein L3J59_15325 [Methylococcaceae bacterium]|nr:hypothetical protein [Methylococcaceae bacterium]
MAVKKKKACWLFPTNTNNLRMILAQGLLTSPEGFSKYYQDILADYNGYLPLFNNQISAGSLEKAVSEAEHLVPCLLEFNLSTLSGQVTTLINGETKEVNLGSDLSGLDGDIDQILIPLPMPLACLSKIIFKTKDDINGFKKDAEGRSNVVLNNIKLSSTKAESKLFETTDTDTLLACPYTQINKIEAPEIKTNYLIVYAYGGMLSLLFYHAKNGALSHSFFDDFSRGVTPESKALKEQAIPQFIHNYFHSEIGETRPENKILKGIVSSCIESDDFKNSLINFLRNGNWDEKSGKKSQELADELCAYASYSSLTASEWFDSAKSDIKKVLLMLFTREDSDSLIDFHNPKTNFTEREHLFFAMFFGIRDSFIKVPKFIREYNGLQVYVSNQMASYAHKKMGSKITFKKINPPKTVWQFVDEKLSKINTRSLGLESCVQTIMSAKVGFKHEKGMNIYNGYLEPQYKIVDNDYFKIISIKKLTDIEYNKLK